MKGILEWVRQITCYLIFVTVLMGLLPNKSYEKYVRLFAGMVLVLLALRPITGGLGLDEQVARLFEAIRVQEEAGELADQISGLERERLNRIMEGYQETVEQEVEAMAASEGLAASASARMETDPEREGFGRVREIRLVLSEPEEGEAVEPVKIGISVEPVEVEPVGETGTENGSVKEAGASGQTLAVSPEAAQAAETLAERIVRDYGLEDDHVEIQWKD